jgi:hypothetical protein
MEKLESNQKEKVKNVLDEIKKLLKEKDIEIFMFESPENHYQPTVPEEYFGMRSHKNRIFVPLQILREFQKNSCYNLDLTPYKRIPL